MIRPTLRVTFVAKGTRSICLFSRWMLKMALLHGYLAFRYLSFLQLSDEKQEPLGPDCFGCALEIVSGLEKTEFTAQWFKNNQQTADVLAVFSRKRPQKQFRGHNRNIPDWLSYNPSPG